MKIKTSELNGVALDWAVTKAEGFDSEVDGPVWGMWKWATDWGQGGPIIEREGVSLTYENGDWYATMQGKPTTYFSYDPLVSAMRCYVASHFGDEVEVPDCLI